MFNKKFFHNLSISSLKEGFTLVELTIFVVIVGIIFVTVGSIIVEASRALSFVINRSELIQGLDIALLRLENDLMSIPWRRQSFSCIGAWGENANGLTIANATHLAIGCGYQVDFYYWDKDHNRLIRRSNNIEDILLDKVTNLSFTYFDYKDSKIDPVATTEDRLSIASVGVAITVGSEEQSISRNIRISLNSANQPLGYKFN